MIGALLVFQVYKVEDEDADEEWRWRLRNLSNDKIIAESAEGYAKHQDCKRSIDIIRAGMARCRVDDPVTALKEFYKKTKK